MVTKLAERQLAQCFDEVVTFSTIAGLDTILVMRNNGTFSDTINWVTSSRYLKFFL